MQMHAWLQGNPEARVEFSSRVKNFAPYANESLTFMLNVGAVEVVEEGILLTNFKPASLSKRKDEVAECYRKAAVIGRWFAEAGSIATIFTMWGVRP